MTRPPARRDAPLRRAQPAPLPADALGHQLTVAAEAIAAVRAGQALNDGLLSLWAAHPELDAGGRGAVTDLVFGTLRDYGRGEFWLARLLRTPLSEAHIDALLRVALHRLEQRPASAHTVVDQAVEAAARIAHGGLKGLVNAVLRNALRQRETLQAAASADPVAHWRHPDWWIARLQRDFPDTWQAALEAGNSHPPMCLRVNRRRADRAEMTARLAAAGIANQPLGDTALLLPQPLPVASLPGYAEGLCSVQDWGAQQAAPLLDPQPGMRVLDACAAPGGKSAHLLEYADIELTAVDLDPTRLAHVGDNLARLGLRATLVAGDARRPQAWWDGQPFERILLDLPCSASGVARRHPDIKWLRRPLDVGTFATVQGEILRAVWPLLAPAGRILYATCSVFAEENSRQLAEFAATHADCRRLPGADGRVERQWLPAAEHDGFFYALLEKRPS